MDVKTLQPSSGARVATESGQSGAERTQPAERVARQGIPTRASTRIDASDGGMPAAHAARRGRIATHQRINEHASGMQQVLAYLGGLDTRLNALKQALGARLAGGGSDSEVHARVERVTTEWRRRADATGGRLSDALELGGAGSARRAFTLRGLNAQDARRAEGEAVTFQLGGTGARPATVYLGPDLSAREMVYHLKVGLGQLGLDCDMDAQGRVRFSVEETRWPLVSRGLHVKGGGVRLPAGAPQRAAIVDGAERIDTVGWEIGDRSAMRETLRQTVSMMTRVQQAAMRAERTLAGARQTLAAMPSMPDAAWASTTGERVVEQATRGGYANATVLMSIAAGLDRTQVHALLSLR